jgi:hypothetical protein
MDDPFFFIVVTLGIFAVLGIIGIIIGHFLIDKEQPQT